MPRVSVCIPAYNHAAYLPVGLDSVLSQSYPDFEIIVADDGSTDGCLEVAQGFARAHPEKVRVVTHPGGENRGVTATFNLAVSHSRGEYLAWLGSDDVWLPGKLEAQVRQLEQHPEWGLVYSLAEVIDAEGRRTGDSTGQDLTGDLIPGLVAGNFIPNLTVIHRRSCIEQYGLYDPVLLYSDWEMWLRLADHQDFGFLNQILAQYRVHGQNVFAAARRANHLQRDLDVLLSIQSRAESSQGRLHTPRNLALIALRTAAVYFAKAQPETARQYFDLALRHDPRLLHDIPYLVNWLARIDQDPAFALQISGWISGTSLRYKREFHGAVLAYASWYYQSRDPQKARSSAVASIQATPFAILNRPVARILLEMGLGEKTIHRLRKMFAK